MNASIYFNNVLRRFYSSLHHIEEDNYDAGRFSHDGVDRSNSFDNNRHADYMTLFSEQREAFFSTWLMLRDDISRERFTRLILYRLLGHLHARVSDEARASGDGA